MAKEIPTAKDMVNTTLAALRAPSGFEKRAGQCKRFVRQVCGAAGVPARNCPPVEIDAKECAEWYRENRPELCKKNGSVPGDILFYEKGHGPHGHVVVRLPGNLGGENSTAHAPEGTADGRGVRPLKAIGTPSLIVRVWR